MEAERHRDPLGNSSRSTFTTPASVNNAYAATVIRVALNRTQLEHY
jgi:hypothetical protein